MSGWLDRLRMRGVQVDEFVRSIPTPQAAGLDLAPLPRGIDNVHVDVQLSDAFALAASDLITTLVKQSFAWLASHGATALKISPGQAAAFVSATEQQMERAMAQARRAGSLDVVRVLQLAQIKLVLVQTASVTRTELTQLRLTREQEDQHESGRALELQELLVRLTQNQSRLQAEVNRRVLGLLEQTEERKLRRLRKALLGRSWPIPREVLFNPLLRIPGLGHPNLLAEHYTLILDAQGKNAVASMNRLFVSVFADLLPEAVTEVLSWSSDVNPASSRPIERLDQGSLSGFLETEMILKESLGATEYSQPVMAWLDAESCARSVLSSEMNTTYARALKESDDPASYSRYRRLVQHQRRLIERWRVELQRAGLLRAAIASLNLGPLLKTYGTVLSVSQLQCYLADPRSRKQLRPKIQVRLDTQPMLLEMTDLDQAAAEVDRLAGQRDAGVAVEYLLAFLRYRRDLKQAYQMHWAMDQIRVLDLEQELTLSRSNRTLLSFEPGADAPHQGPNLRYHAVVKADLRGSTELTQALLKKNLNPASHFTLNFFQPIESLLATFDAEKVFIEGDAVILNLNQYQGGEGTWLALARACGLAREILQVVQRQNEQTQRHGLPALEVGVGVAMSTDQPAFLQDGGRRIMISPAISTADRLSSCDASLRERVASKGERASLWYDQDRWLLFNVNGVLLERAAFERLRQEMSLHSGELKLPGCDYVSRVYAGRYPDAKNTLRWLLVREPKARPLDPGNTTPPAEPSPWLEVVTGADALLAAQRQLGG